LTGLKEEIRAPVALHMPRDVDTACALALLQEEELNASKQKTFGQGFTKGLERVLTDKVGINTGDKQLMKV
jgi:hypothetical protein